MKDGTKRTTLSSTKLITISSTEHVKLALVSIPFLFLWLPFIASHHSEREEDDPVHISNCRKPFSLRPAELAASRRSQRQPMEMGGLWSAAADWGIRAGRKSSGMAGSWVPPVGGSGRFGWWL